MSFWDLEDAPTSVGIHDLISDKSTNPKDVILHEDLIATLRTKDPHLIDYLKTPAIFKLILSCMMADTDPKAAGICFNVFMLPQSPFLENLLESKVFMNMFMSSVSRFDDLRFGYISQIFLKIIKLDEKRAVKHIIDRLVYLPTIIKFIHRVPLQSVMKSFILAAEIENRWIVWTLLGILYPQAVDQPLPEVWEDSMGDIAQTLGLLYNFQVTTAHKEGIFAVLSDVSSDLASVTEFIDLFNSSLPYILGVFENPSHKSLVFETAMKFKANNELRRLSLELLTVDPPVTSLQVSALRYLTKHIASDVKAVIGKIVENLILAKNNSFYALAFKDFAVACFNNQDTKETVLTEVSRVVLRYDTLEMVRKDYEVSGILFELARAFGDSLRLSEQFKAGAYFTWLKMREGAVPELLESEKGETIEEDTQNSEIKADQTDKQISGVSFSSSPFGDFNKSTEAAEAVQFPPITSKESEQQATAFVPDFGDEPARHEERPLFPAFGTPEESPVKEERPLFPAFDTQEGVEEKQEKPLFPAFDTPEESPVKEERPLFPAFDSQEGVKEKDERPLFPAFDTPEESPVKEERPLFPAFDSVEETEDNTNISFPSFEEKTPLKDDAPFFPAFDSFEDPAEKHEKPLFPAFTTPLEGEDTKVSFEPFTEESTEPKCPELSESVQGSVEDKDTKEDISFGSSMSFGTNNLADDFEIPTEFAFGFKTPPVFKPLDENSSSNFDKLLELIKHPHWESKEINSSELFTVERRFNTPEEAFAYLTKQH